MIPSSFLNLVYKAGDIASQLDQLYDKMLNGGRFVQVIDNPDEVPIGEAIKQQENRLKEYLNDIQKGFKTQFSIE